MEFSYRDYCQYLLSSQTNYTLTYLADHLPGVSHDTINRYLRNQPFPPHAFWSAIKAELETDEEAVLVFDDTVLNKYSSQKIEIARYQYSGAEKRVIQGIGLVSCLYINVKSQAILGDRLSNLQSRRRRKNQARPPFGDAGNSYL